MTTFQGKKDQVDLLFLVDDSASMSPEQSLLKARFRDLINTLDALADGTKKASYHIGVITSSMGMPGTTYPNLGGRLQARGADAASDCASPTPSPAWPRWARGARASRCRSRPSITRSAIRSPRTRASCARTRSWPSSFLTDEDDCSVEPASDLWTTPTRGVASSFRIENLGESCLTSPIADRAHPDCVVEEVIGADDAAARTSIPSCTMSGGARPCWELVDVTDPQSTCKQVCDPTTAQFQRVRIEIRRDVAAPLDATAKISCLTIAIPSEHLCRS